MGQKTSAQIQKELAEPFAPQDLEWRLQHVGPSKQDAKRLIGMAVPYVTNRAIMTRLDNVVGPENWYNEYKPWHGAGKKEAQICGISIYFEGRGFITKWDGAEDSDIEPVKGGLSDSMKRSAVQWGIGRILYSMDTVWVDAEQRGKSTVIKDSERSKLDQRYVEMLDKLGLKPAKATGIQSLLTPTPDKENSQAGVPDQPSPGAGRPLQGAQNAPAQATQPQGGNQSGKPATEPAPDQKSSSPSAECQYRVTAVKRQPGMNGQGSTLLKLTQPDGKQLNVFARGEFPALVPGIQLTGVELEFKQQDTVAFYVLKQYEIVDAQPQAA